MLSALDNVNDQTKLKAIVLSSLQIIAGSLLLSLAAHIKIPLFFTPIPLSLQTFAILLMAATLGSKKSASSVFLYFFMGFSGVPVFASGPSQIGLLFGPSGGYIVGFLVQAFLAGWLIEKLNPSTSLKLFAVLFLSCLIQLSFGFAWLSQFVGWKEGVAMGLSPFFFGEALKALAVTALVKIRRYAGANGHYAA